LFANNYRTNFVTIKNVVMLEKSLAVLFFLKKPNGYIAGERPIYMRITVNGIPREIKQNLAVMLNVGIIKRKDPKERMRQVKH